MHTYTYTGNSDFTIATTITIIESWKKVVALSCLAMFCDCACVYVLYMGVYVSVFYTLLYCLLEKIDRSGHSPIQSYDKKHHLYIFSHISVKFSLFSVFTLEYVGVYMLVC